MSNNNENDDNTKNTGQGIELTDFSPVPKGPAPSISLMPMAAAATAMIADVDKKSTTQNELWSFSGAIFYFVFLVYSLI